jgi:carbohydrate-binding DOMON domain-containing protein
MVMVTWCWRIGFAAVLGVVFADSAAAQEEALFEMLLRDSAAAQEVMFKDPVGDDKGPGAYTYPTDVVYKAGSFDLTSLKVQVRGEQAEFEVGLNALLEDPWRMGSGFSVQMIFIFIDTDHKEGSGFTQGLPGLNVAFAPADGWDRCIILSPQSRSRVRAEVEGKAGAMKAAVLVPNRTKGSSRNISGAVPLAELGGGDPTTWGFQVVVQSNEGYPGATDLLTRKVNEYEGQHRFGGGNDGECDPHAMDILAGQGTGASAEAEAQFKALAFECSADGTAKKLATLPMVRK